MDPPRFGDELEQYRDRHTCRKSKQSNMTDRPGAPVYQYLQRPQ